MTGELIQGAEAVIRPVPGLQVIRHDTGMVYTLGNQITSGGFGETWEAMDRFNEQLVAKVIKPRGEPKSTIRQEWLKEVDLLLRLRHPNVIHIYDAFEFGNLYYLILERAHGSLRDFIGLHGRCDDHAVIEIGRQVLSAMHYVHLNGVIHRDLHIDNVLYSADSPRQWVKVADFGLSKLVGDGGQRYAWSQVGRAFEISPELVREGYTTPQSDIYQVGLILYHLNAGVPALSDADGEWRQAILSGIACTRAQALGSALGNSIAGMLSPSREYRWDNALDAWLALRASLG